MSDFEQKKQDRIKHAIEIFKFCMEYDDPRLDEVIWVRTLPSTNPRANVPFSYNEPLSIRKAMLAILFDFPSKMNVDTRIIDDDGIEYYESKSEFVSPSECTPEQQAMMKAEKDRLKNLIIGTDDGTAPATNGHVSINVNLWMDLDEPDFENIVDWLNGYCKKNIDGAGLRETKYVSVDITKEVLERCGYDVESVSWEKIPEITSKDVVEAIQEKENDGKLITQTTLMGRIKAFFDEKRRERLGRKIARNNNMMENDRWDHRR